MFLEWFVFSSVLTHTLADSCADPTQFVAQNKKCLTDNNITFTLPNDINVAADNVVETMKTVLTLADPATMCSNLDAWGKALECVFILGGQCPSVGGGTTDPGQKLNELKTIQQEACFDLKQAGSVMIVPTGRHIYQKRGGTLRLACAGVGLGGGTDAPVYQWKDTHRHDINVTQGRVHVINMGTSSILVINNIQGSDEGTYLCTASPTKTSHATAYTAARVYDAFHVSNINCNDPANYKAAFDECAHYYNITGLTFSKPLDTPDLVTNNANVFFTQDIQKMCSNPTPYNQAARCVMAVSWQCLNGNAIPHSGNDVVEGMETICSAYVAGSYNDSCVNSAKDDMAHCNIFEFANWSMKVDKSHGYGKAELCRIYGIALDCAEKFLQVCTPKMHTVEAFKAAYRAMELSQCATDNSQPGAVTDSRVCFHSADLHAQYRQCFIKGNYSITLPAFITEMEMTYTIPALVVLQTTADTCSDTAPLKVAAQCVRDISRPCLFHNWYNLIHHIPQLKDVEAAIQYKCTHIADYDATCAAPNSPKVFQCAWQKMANEFNLVYQRNMQAMFCRMREHVDECVQSALAACPASSRKTFLNVNNILSPTQNGCQKFGHAVAVSNIIG
ncbi:uncharacterized protein LOC124134701 [Haliotis rufescens]|uniref:uncharacterized protein LOC124134701 n=1 Tax=Haliotis rufescens TaxID=6454 RepID=UPI00201E7A60|nr:uncharacterized protein LOC124134701 [Haliotis rufescens]